MVHRVILARSRRDPVSANEIDALAKNYPHAKSLQLRGPLCEGDRHDHAWNGQRCRWHEWQHVLPEWLGHPASAAAGRHGGQATSVAVIAASMSTAEPLMDLIVSEGAAAVWCPCPDAIRVRGVDAVWWDDSVAGPTSQSQWRHRLATCKAATDRCRHLWLVNGPRREACVDALGGGVSLVLGKPFRIDCLVHVLAGRAVPIGEAGTRFGSVVAA
jgi:hypothetical protein